MSTDFFDMSSAGDPTWFQHGLWFLGHWEVLKFGIGCLFAGYVLIALRLWKGRFRHPASRAYLIAIGLTFIAIILFSGWSAWFNDTMILHDTYYVVPALWWFGPLLAGFPLLAVLFSRLSPRPSVWLSMTQFSAYVSGFTLIGSSHFVPWLLPTPRRYVDYQDHYDIWNSVMALGAGLICVSLLTLLVILVQTGLQRRQLKNDTKND